MTMLMIVRMMAVLLGITVVRHPYDTNLTDIPKRQVNRDVHLIEHSHTQEIEQKDCHHKGTSRADLR
jgi:hypothetical protein